MAGRNARLGLALFAVYALFYGTFVLANAFAAEVMDWSPVAGLNLAVLSGFGLIVLALFVALIYGFAASSEPHKTPEKEEAS